MKSCFFVKCSRKYAALMKKLIISMELISLEKITGNTIFYLDVVRHFARHRGHPANISRGPGSGVQG